MKQGRTLRVGLFVVVALILATVAIFVIGDNRRVWDTKLDYHLAYDDVLGLRTGSVVRMGGIDVGSVSSVTHGKEARDDRVYVRISIARNETTRIRAATVATIEGKGLLGDKMIQLTYDKKLADKLALEGRDPLAITPEGGEIATAPPGDPVGDAAKAAQAAKYAMEDLRKVTEDLADEQFKNDIQGTARALREILEGVSQKDGVAHRMIFDPEEAKRVDRILSNLDATTANLAHASADAREIAAHAKSGPGLAHALVYDPDLAKGTTGTVVELHKSLEALRTSNGIGHAVIYGDDQTQHFMGNMNAMSDDLRQIVADVKAGRGTLGALLVDPTIYEDVKSLVGNVERNQVLRALVRYSIKQNEDRPHTEVKDVPQPTVQPAQQKAATP